MVMGQITNNTAKDRGRFIGHDSYFPRFPSDFDTLNETKLGLKEYDRQCKRIITTVLEASNNLPTEAVLHHLMSSSGMGLGRFSCLN